MDSQEGILNDAPQAQINDSAREPIPPSSPIPEPLNVTETSKLIAELYERLGPRLGAMLVEANVVLTLAGARGQTEISIRNPLPNDGEQINSALADLKNKDIRITPANTTRKAAFDGAEILPINIESLRGYERVSKLTHISGVEPYDSSTGWEGLKQWAGNCISALEKAQKDGKIITDDENLIHLFVGIIKGYPDLAINDMNEWIMNNRKSPITSSDIPYVSLYKGAEPNFDFSPDHKNDPAIVDTVNQWGNILKVFYSSPWHQQIQKDPAFIEAREAINNRSV